MTETQTTIFVNDIVRVNHPGITWNGEICMVTKARKQDGEEWKYDLISLREGLVGFGIPISKLEVLCTGAWIQENRHKFAEDVIIQRVKMPDDMGTDVTIHRTMEGANKTFRTTVGLYEEYDRSDFKRSTSTVPLLD